MDCQEAQRIISEALDGDQAASAAVGEAKEHCAGCRDCLGYVKSLAAVSRAPLPEPPDDLADRVMAKIREETESTAAEEALLAVAAAQDGATRGDAADADPRSSTAAVDVKALWDKLWRPENRRTVAMWAGAAAMLLAFVGIVAISGVNAILRSGTPQTGTAKTSVASGQRDTSAENLQAAPEAAVPGSSDTSAGTAGSESASTAAAPAVGSVVAGGFVYRVVGPSTYARSNLATGGTTTSSLSSSDPPKSLAYYFAPEKNKIVVDDGTGNLIVFELVTRDFAGRQFAMRSGDILSYRAWPVLPPPMTAPASKDGAPQFQPAGTSMGVPAYVQAGTTADAGVAIGPGTPATDPAGGNPGWTWWTPLQ